MSKNTAPTAQFRLRQILAKGIRYLHHGILLFILSASFLPYPALWYFQAFFIPIVIFQWQMNEGDCFLTNLEHRIAGTHQIEEKNPEFSREFLEKITGWSPNAKQMKFIIYGTVIFMWAVAACKVLILEFPI